MKSMCVFVILTLCSLILMSECYPRPSDDGSMCPNVSCSPPLPGASCTPKYERDDGCCPVWYCTASNGATSQIYGKSTGGSSSSSSFSSSSSSFGNPPSGGFGGFPTFQIQLPNFASLFG